MPFETLELRHGDDRLSLVATRGAIVTRWYAAGRERLYLEEATLEDATKNVRGGVPLLFPSPGKLKDGTYERDAKHGAMKQHGFARDLPWTVTERTEATATLTLSANDATRAVFPWEFALTLSVTLGPGRVRLALHVANPGKEPLPFAFGVHPYFKVEDKAQATITTGATRAYDNVRGENIAFQGFHLGEGETDLHLLDHGSTTSTLSAPSGERITLSASPELTRWVVWTLPGRDFVCVEPWTAPGNALNTGEGLLTLAPGAARDLWIELAAG
jgi:galactose mutarotase-like enzyme